MPSGSVVFQKRIKLGSSVWKLVNRIYHQEKGIFLISSWQRKDNGPDCDSLCVLGASCWWSQGFEMCMAMLSKVKDVNVGWILFSAVITHSFKPSYGPQRSDRGRTGVRRQGFILCFSRRPSIWGATESLTRQSASRCFNLLTYERCEIIHTLPFSKSKVNVEVLVFKQSIARSSSKMENRS